VVIMPQPIGVSCREPAAARRDSIDLIVIDVERLPATVFESGEERAAILIRARLGYELGMNAAGRPLGAVRRGEHRRLLDRAVVERKAGAEKTCNAGTSTV